MRAQETNENVNWLAEKCFLIGLLLLLLSACDKALTNQEIVDGKKFCDDHGLRAIGWHNNFFDENSITKVECQI